MITTLVYKQVAAAGITTANTLQTLYTVPASTTFVGEVFLTNTNPSVQVTARLAIVGSGASPSAGHYMVYDYPLLPNESWCSNQITLEVGAKIWIVSDTVSSVTPGTGLTAQVYGELQVTS